MGAIRRVLLWTLVLGACGLMQPDEAPCVDCPTGKPCFSDLVCRPRFCPDLKCRVVDASSMRKVCVEVSTE